MNKRVAPLLTESELARCSALKGFGGLLGSTGLGDDRRSAGLGVYLFTNADKHL